MTHDIAIGHEILILEGLAENFFALVSDGLFIGFILILIIFLLASLRRG